MYRGNEIKGRIDIRGLKLRGVIAEKGEERVDRVTYARERKLVSLQVA